MTRSSRWGASMAVLTVEVIHCGRRYVFGATFLDDL